MGPLTAAQTSSAALTGPPNSASVPAAALGSASTAVATAIAAVTAATTTAAATVGSDCGASSGHSACACMPLVLSLTAVVKDMGTVFTVLLDAHVQERQATTADFRALRNGVAVILSNSTENKDELDRVHKLANSASLGVEKLVRESVAAAHTNGSASGLQRGQEGHVTGSPSTAATPVVDDAPRAAPWAIPVQVRAGCECHCVLPLRALFGWPVFVCACTALVCSLCANI